MKSLFSLFTASNPARRIALAFLLALLFIALGFVLSFYSYNRYGNDDKQVKHTLQVISLLESILSSIKDVETGVRGYLISGDSLYLEPYRVAARLVPAQLATVRNLISDNTSQLVLLDTLTRQAQAKIQMANSQIQNRNDQRGVLRRLLLGKQRMDKVRQTVALMIAKEDALMKTRTEQARSSYQQTIIIIFLLSILTFLTLIATYNLLDAELTRRQKNEEQLRAYEEELQAHIRQLITSNEELERFAFIASHDLQEPLRKIQSFASLITERNKLPLDGESSLFMTKIVNSANRMSRMIKDLLDFSRVSSLDQSFKTVKLNELINRVLDDMELRVKGLDAEVSVDRLPALPVIPSQMEQVFANLIGNALKYQKPGQKPVVHITSEVVDGAGFPELVPRKQYLKISVTDNGIGFDQKYAENIFQLFQRLHAKTAYDGTGIGLAVCKRIVVAHQGYITAYGTPGEGATFVIVLPEKQTSPDYERLTNRQASTHLVG
jgi:signal transduction histidine kinase